MASDLASSKQARQWRYETDSGLEWARLPNCKEASHDDLTFAPWMCAVRSIEMVVVVGHESAFAYSSSWVRPYRQLQVRISGSHHRLAFRGASRGCLEAMAL